MVGVSSNSSEIHLVIYGFVLATCIVGVLTRLEIWEGEMSGGLGHSTESYSSAFLKCGSRGMVFSVETNSPFSGVFYSRGHFRAGPPCSHRPPPTSSLKIHIGYDECNTKNASGVYSNVVVLQHDLDLLMPGDAAFDLVCDLTSTHTVTVESSMNTSPIVSKITLADASPGPSDTPEDERPSVSNASSSVVFSPRKNRLLPKQEL